MLKNDKINVRGIDIAIIKKNKEDYISLTDMVKNIEDGAFLIDKWLQNKNTIEFIGTWEEIINKKFNFTEFTIIKNEAGLNRFTLTVNKWIEKTNAIGILSNPKRYGGNTFAHKDIAFEFGSWINPSFKLYLIKEFQRMKDEENNRLKIELDILTDAEKNNYKLHSETVRENLIPMQLNTSQLNTVYNSEDDTVNMALFTHTAKQWKDKHPCSNGNIRDYASIVQLVVLSNLDRINKIQIENGIGQSERLQKLNKEAINQMTSLIQRGIFDE